MQNVITEARKYDFDISPENTSNPSFPCKRESSSLVFWIPAFAGMTFSFPFASL